jgi:nucleotide-binding universal stress UspA family protein
VLFATDGSAAAQTALELVGSLRWPDGTVLRVLQVLPPSPIIVGPDAADRHEALSAAARRALDDLAGPLRRSGRTVEEQLVRGAPVADLIVADARQWNADLVVVGNRGHGALVSMLLGSVAAAVTDSAHCPVLVARGPRIERIVFAEDGSEGAFEARHILSTWPIFRGLVVRVVSVAHVARSLRSGITATVAGEVRRSEADALRDARVAHERLAKDCATDLALRGVLAQAEACEGDAAAEIVASADRVNADLIVMGSRGRTGLARAVLGSVARDVLQHARCSVLIVRHGVAPARELVATSVVVR